MRTVYRVFDVNGGLLYVGSTHLDPLQRLAGHRNRPWWADATTITLEHFESERGGYDAECAAIQSEAPRYNVQSQRPAAREAYVARMERQAEAHAAGLPCANALCRRCQPQRNQAVA